MTVQDRMNEYWTWRAPSYDRDQRGSDRELWGGIWSRAQLGPEVLDVGTGSGFVAHLLAARGHRVTGIDLSDGMLEQARSHGGTAEFVPGDAVDPPFGPESFDAVVNRYVLWTLRDPAAAVRNWRRLLRPGGRLAVVDGGWFPDGLTAGAGAEFAAAYSGTQLPLESGSPAPLRELLLSEGFVDVSTETLTDLFEHDQRHGVSPGHRPTLQYLTTATNPRDQGTHRA